MEERKMALGMLNFSGSGGANTYGLLSALTQGREFDLDRPTSYRTYDTAQNRNERGQFASGRHEIEGTRRISETGDLNKKTARAAVDSTAIANARYDPSDDSLNIAYTSNPGKEYKFQAGGPEGVSEWLNAPSKGRITQEWRSTHRYPGY